MSTQTVTVTSFENVSGNNTRLHFTALYDYSFCTTFSVTLSGSANLQWNFVGYDSGGNIVVDKYWYDSGYMLELVGVANIENVVKWELWIRFADNAAITPADITSAVCSLISEDSGWYIGADGITNEEFLDDVPYMAEPFPVSIWQCRQTVDSGFAYVPLFPDAVDLNPVPVPQIPYIMVYDITTPQSTLALQQNNGLAILTPTACEDEEELCGAWTLSMEHPIDPEGRWKLLQEGNIIRAGGQLFTIKYTEEIWQGNSGKVSVNAEHIFYQYADNWVFASPVDKITFIAYSGATFLRQIEDSLTDKIVIPGGQVYAYTWRCDMHYGMTPYKLRLEDGRNPVDMILGDGGLISAKGGELYRDNFYFSIKERKEGASDNGFDIRIGKNMTGIKRTIDTTSLCTFYRLYEANSGQYVELGWDSSSAILPYLPHHIVRSESVSYPQEGKWYLDELQQEAIERFKKIYMPFMCYEIDLEDVRQNPDFEIVKAESLRCGDIGRVYDRHLGGALMLEITGTTYDRITGKCKKIIIGQKQSFVYHPNLPIVWDDEGHPIEPETKGFKIWVQDSTGRYLKDSTGRKIVIVPPTA